MANPKGRAHPLSIEERREAIIDGMASLVTGLSPGAPDEADATLHAKIRRIRVLSPAERIDRIRASMARSFSMVISSTRSRKPVRGVG